MELHSPTSTPSEEEFPRLQPPAKQSKGMILNTPYVQPVTVKNFPKRENIPAEVIDRRRKSVFQNLIHNSTFAFGNVHLENQNFVFTYEGQTYTFTPKVHLVEKLSTLKKHPIFTNSVPTLITPLVSVVPPPPPTPDSHIVLKNNPAMFLTPRQHKCRLHANAGMHCQCTLLKYHYTISLFVPEFCFKNTLVNPKDFVVHDPSPDLCFNENTSHVYHYNSVEENHILSLTSPFLLSKKWPPKAYLPATSLTSDKAKLRQFFTLADPHYYRTVREIYLDQPENWSEESHPFFGEPSDRDELSLYSRPLYSAETLNRTLFTVHPTFGNEIPVFSCTNQQLETPILSMSHKNLLDDFLDAFLSPFLLKGHGSILCPVCISHISNSKYPAFLSRSEFRAHFRDNHHNQLPFIGLAFSTRYNSRLYEAFYIYCKINHLSNEPDMVSEPPHDKNSLAIFDCKLSSILQNLFVPQPAAVHQRTAPPPRHPQQSTQLSDLQGAAAMAADKLSSFSKEADILLDDPFEAGYQEIMNDKPVIPGLPPDAQKKRRK